MSRVVPPSGERVEATKRRPMSKARALRIWTREAGVCYLCGQFAALEDAEIEHPVTVWMSGPDDDDELRVVHAANCHVEKSKTDTKERAKVKRIHARIDGTRRTRAKINSPGFSEWRGTWPKRSFGKRKP